MPTDFLSQLSQNCPRLMRGMSRKRSWWRRTLWWSFPGRFSQITLILSRYFCRFFDPPESHQAKCLSIPKNSWRDLCSWPVRICFDWTTSTSWQPLLLLCLVFRIVLIVLRSCFIGHVSSRVTILRRNAPGSWFHLFEISIERSNLKLIWGQQLWDPSSGKFAQLQFFSNNCTSWTNWDV